MQEWLNDKKNLPIIIGLAAVVLTAAIVFILFQTGVLGGSGNGNAAGGVATVAPSPASVPPAAPGAPVPPSAPAAPVAAATAAAPAPGVKVAAAPPVVGAPGARPDPFEPYIDYNTWLKNIIKHLPPPPRVDSYVPFVRITNYVPPTPQFQSQPTRPGVPLPTTPNGPTTQASIGRVSGVMLTNGAFAIVDNNGQSSILQPGDQLPNGEGRVISIQADGITVKTTGDQMVKVPISSGESANTPGGPQGPQGPPTIPGNIPQTQDDNSNGG